MAKNKKTEELKEFKITSLNEYRSFALRTMTNLGTEEKNSTHMISGIITEIGELTDVYKKEFAYNKQLDKINVIEEWGDQMWFISCQSTIKNYKFEVDESLINFFRRTNDKKSEIKLVGEESIKILIASINNSQYLTMYLSWLFYLAERLEIDIYDALTKNILKLKERFGDTFSDIKAINRNLDNERKILENEG